MVGNGATIFDVVNFAVSIALTLTSLFVSIFAIYISRQETKRATELLDLVAREIRGVAIRSERTERATEQLFDTTMRALISATLAGQQNAFNVLRGSKTELAKLVDNSLSQSVSLSENERRRIVDEVASKAVEAIENRTNITTARSVSSTVRTASSGNRSQLDDIIRSSENPPIAEKYIETITNYPSMLSIEAIRATNYAEYVRILDFLISEGVLSVEEGRLAIGSKFKDEVIQRYSQS